METATASAPDRVADQIDRQIDRQIEFRGGHHPSAAAVRRALTAITTGNRTPGSGTTGPITTGDDPAAFPAVVDATPLGAADSHQALQALAGAAALLGGSLSVAGQPGSIVFLLPAAVDGPAAAAAVRRWARSVAPHWRLNVVRIGRSAEDAARTVAFALSCRSFTGQLVALDQPLQASIPVQPDLRPSAPTAGATQASATREVMIRDLVLPCRVGVRRHERDAPQRVRVNLKLVVDETPLHDRLEDVVCYDEIVDHIRRIATGGHVNLVETLAQRIADGCFDDPRVRSARVAVEKLDVYSDATAAGVRIIRHRPDSP